ncbi:MAG: FG-GAP-like repeat-containing protein, partial [Frankiaceae bacterium]
MLVAGFLTLSIATAGAASAGVVTASSAAAASTSPVLFGLGSPTNGARATTEAALGVKSAIVGSFATQTNSPDFWVHWADDVRAGGAVLQLFWDPTPGIKDNANSSLRSIINGSHDAYIKHWTGMVRDYGHPVIIRLMAEMNGNWQPFSPGINGNVASEFPLAWRHVVNLARSQNADNILWDWNPNKPSTGSTSLASLWPGSAYVDWIGLDLYNWGDAAHGPWTSFSSLMAPAVAAIRAVAGDKPLMLNEVGTSPAGDKAAWLAGMFASLPSFGVKAVIYFDYNLDADWRLNSPATAMAATKAAVHAAPYVTGDDQAVTVTEHLLTAPSTPAAHTVADFDGNGTTDLAVYRPGNGSWYIRNGRSVAWGRSSDLPVPADYNGDGRTDIAVYRPTNTRWYISGTTSIAYGTRGDIPVPADYNGDGHADLAVYRPT